MMEFPIRKNTGLALDASADGKMVCFLSEDLAGNIGLAMTSTLSVAGPVPDTTWSPVNNGYMTSLSGNVTLEFASNVYSDNTCATEFTNTTAGAAVTLGTTSGGDDIAKTVTYDAATDTITIDPTSDFTDETLYYASVSNAWHYRDGACAPGVTENISFTVSTTAPTISSLVYRLNPTDTNTITNVD